MSQLIFTSSSLHGSPTVIINYATYFRRNVKRTCPHKMKIIVIHASTPANDSIALRGA